MLNLHIFRTNVVLAAFSSYILALSKNSYQKHSRITLMKLTADQIIDETSEAFADIRDRCDDAGQASIGDFFDSEFDKWLASKVK